MAGRPHLNAERRRCAPMHEAFGNGRFGAGSEVGPSEDDSTRHIGCPDSHSLFRSRANRRGDHHLVRQRRRAVASRGRSGLSPSPTSAWDNGSRESSSVRASSASTSWFHGSLRPSSGSTPGARRLKASPANNGRAIEAVNSVGEVSPPESQSVEAVRPAPPRVEIAILLPDLDPCAAESRHGLGARRRWSRPSRTPRASSHC
jgi:hypothetical protein